MFILHHFLQLFFLRILQHFLQVLNLTYIFYQGPIYDMWSKQAIRLLYCKKLFHGQIKFAMFILHHILQLFFLRILEHFLKVLNLTYIFYQGPIYDMWSKQAIRLLYCKKLFHGQIKFAIEYSRVNFCYYHMHAYDVYIVGTTNIIYIIPQNLKRVIQFIRRFTYQRNFVVYSLWLSNNQEPFILIKQESFRLKNVGSYHVMLRLKVSKCDIFTNKKSYQI
eukprot:TRINITY_DN13651_c0_g1_i10.p2 TRINITY_DN13651_c0_g1~~TRINITY_DN13651_c0_g1_i10.p2  ORF type:complete len:221 (+),score=-21.37 TRINITY_DN13651_c0_g1_i10:282-944(+)